MRRFTALASMIGAAVFLTASMAYAAGGDVRANLANGKKIYDEGKGSVPACNSCHGENGMGNDMMGTPRLAGQVTQFVLKQLTDFANDKRMDNTMFVMNMNAKGMSEQDRRDVSAYVNTMPVSTAADLSNLTELASMGNDTGKVYLGKSLVVYGDEEKGIPACTSCHGYNGRGVDSLFPKINEQKFTYLVTQLKNWRDGSRANDPMGQMRAVARKMSDSDIANAAAFLSQTSSYSLGDTRLPEQHQLMGFDKH